MKITYINRRRGRIIMSNNVYGIDLGTNNFKGILKGYRQDNA